MNGSRDRNAVSRIVASLAGAGLALACFGTVLAAEMRTWTDTSGTYRIQARLLRVEGENVFLEREDGEEFKIALRKLSAADQEYIANHAPKTASPFQAAEEPAGSGSASAVAPPGAVPATRQTGPVQFNASVAKAITPAPQGEWKFPPASSSPTASTHPQVISLPPKREFFEDMRLLVSNGGHRVLLAYSTDHVPLEKMTRLILCNLDDGRTLERFGPGKMVALAVSDSGNQVLMRDDVFNRMKKDCLEIWTFTRSGLDQTLQWYPKGDGRSGGCDIRWAAFLGEGRLITIGEWGMLVIWQLAPLKPLYYLKLGQTCSPMLSPDRQYLVCAAGGQLGVIDPKFGKLLAAKSLSSSDTKVLAFSPSGQRLACLTGSNILIWDFSTGELQRKVPLNGTASNWLFWTSEQHVLAGGTLFDVDGQVKLWQYQSFDASAYADGTCWLVPRQSHEATGSLLAVDLPHDSAKQRLKEAAADPEFYVLREDITVRLNLDGLPDAASRDKVGAVLTRKLEGNGCHVGPKGTIDLVGGIEREKPQPKQESSEEIPFHFGPKGPTPPRGPVFPRSPFAPKEVPEQKAPPPTYGTCSLKFVYQGETVWEIGERLPLDGNLEYFWFMTVRLPQNVSKRGTREALGSSEVTPSGLQDTAKAGRR